MVKEKLFLGLLLANMKIKIGISGYGFMGRVCRYSISSYELLKAQPDFKKAVEIVGVYSGPNKAKNIDGLNCFGTLDDLLDSNIDLLYIASPSHLHFEQIIKGLERGKLIVCDKPLVTSTDQMYELRRLERLGIGGKMVMYQEYRMIPSIIEIKKLISNGFIGDLIRFNIRYLHGSYLMPRNETWRMRGAGGGCILDLAPHCLDLIQFLVGDHRLSNPGKSSFTPGAKVEEIAWATINFDKNASGHIEVSRISAGNNDFLELEIFGSKGAIRWNLEDLNQIETFKLDSEIVGWTRSWVGGRTTPSINSFVGQKVSNGWMDAQVLTWAHIIESIYKDQMGCLAYSLDDEFLARLDIALKVQENILIFQQ